MRLSQSWLVVARLERHLQLAQVFHEVLSQQLLEVRDPQIRQRLGRFARQRLQKSAFKRRRQCLSCTTDSGRRSASVTSAVRTGGSPWRAMASRTSRLRRQAAVMSSTKQPRSETAWRTVGASSRYVEIC